jgi:hypothetical protein
VCPETGRKAIFPLKINALISALGSLDRTGAAGTEDARLDRHIARSSDSDRAVAGKPGYPQEPSQSAGYPMMQHRLRGVRKR